MRLYVNGKYTFQISLLPLNQIHGIIIRMVLSQETSYYQKKSYEKRQHTFSHTSQLNITSISDLRIMTYKHYLQQPKSMLEWRLNLILAKYPPQIVKILENGPHRRHPLIRKHLFHGVDDDDDGEN